jgi:hypothetical protein
VRVEFFRWNKAGCLADDGAERSRIKFCVIGNDERFAFSALSRPSQFYMASPLRDYFKPEGTQDGNDLPP